MGIDWTEEHRFTGLRDRRAVDGWRYEALLCEAPYYEKSDFLLMMELAGIKIPELYDMGFSHNNCGGFCVKAGQGHFAKLLEKRPATYAYHEAKEQEIRAHLKKDIAILRDRTGGKTTPLTMKEFRERIEQGAAYDKFEIGGCGCFSGPEV